jgi:hypothetical protein
MDIAKAFALIAMATSLTMSCNRDITRTQRGVEAPAGREAQETTDPRRVPAPAHPDTGPWTGTTPETAPGGY